MNEHEASLKQKKWNDLKSAVGTMVVQEKRETPKTLDELLLNIKDVGFDTFVCQTTIHTEEDKAWFRTRGYEINLTEDEFRQQFQVDPACIWYTPSVAQNCLYLNPETLAAAPFPIQLYEAGIYKEKDMLYRAIRDRETEAAQNEYWGSVLTLPDAARMEYFNLLVEKDRRDIPDLYEMFFAFYVESDYGFRKIKPATLRAVLESKTEEARRETAEKLREYP